MCRYNLRLFFGLRLCPRGLRVTIQNHLLKLSCRLKFIVGKINGKSVSSELAELSSLIKSLRDHDVALSFHLSLSVIIIC